MNASNFRFYFVRSLSWNQNGRQFIRNLCCPVHSTFIRDVVKFSIILCFLFFAKLVAMFVFEPVQLGGFLQKYVPLWHNYVVCIRICSFMWGKFHDFGIPQGNAFQRIKAHISFNCKQTENTLAKYYLWRFRNQVCEMKIFAHRKIAFKHSCRSHKLANWKCRLNVCVCVRLQNDSIVAICVCARCCHNSISCNYSVHCTVGTHTYVKRKPSIQSKCAKSNPVEGLSEYAKHNWAIY